MNKRCIPILLLTGLVSFSALADLTINGFASIKAGMTTKSDRTLYGYDDKIDFKNESLIALQIRSDLGDKLSVTAQLLGRGQEDFDVGFEWAFISYQLSDNMTINAGRLRTPFYKYSDFKDVGYAYDWLRVPQGVYGLGFDNIEGISFYRTAQLGGMESSLQLVAGGYSGTTSFSGTEVNATIDSIAGITWELSAQALSMRLAYLTGKTSIDVSPIVLAPGFNVGNLFTTLDSVGVSALRRDIDIVNESAQFLGGGLTYDDGDWIAVTELTQVKVNNSFIATQRNYYLSVGKRFNSFTPYISFEREDNKSKNEIYQPYASALPPALFQPVVGLVTSQARKADTMNLGLRYDFHPSAAFKLQYSSEDNKRLNRQSDLIALGIDLVF
ncbi:porin [Arsukibacterium sp.]|uniref:porin n=1 Tax=Arsukibacterium sp. TaxID=1977258 RepID=UPI002FDA27F9